MATNSNFNLSKTAKRFASFIDNPTRRREFTKLMTQAEAAYANGKNRKFSDPAVAQKGPKGPASE